MISPTLLTHHPPLYSIASSRSPLSPTSSSTKTRTHEPFHPDNLAPLIDKSKSLAHLLQIHAFILRHGLRHGLHDHPILNFKLQRSYSSLGRLNYSVSLFDRTRNKNVFFYTSIINGHALNGCLDQVLGYYVEMLSLGVDPNEFTFSSILKCCPLEHGRAVHTHVLKFGFDSDLYVRTGLVDVYARGGDVVSARKVFEDMPERSLVSFTSMLTCYAKHGEISEARLLFDGMGEKDVVCWNVMIDAYTQHSMPNESLMLFSEMLEKKVRPNEVTMVSVLSACGQLGALETGRWIHSYIVNKGIQINVRVGTALVDMYGKCGSLEDARSVFDKIHNKDIVAWNSMIVGYAMHGFSQDALQLFKDLLRVGYKPTDITFIGVLSACAHAGLVDEGWEFFNSIKAAYGIEPKIEHYGCMVNLLGRAGHLEQAYKLVKNMKTEPDPILWGTLLGACRLHNNIALGEEIAEFLVSQDLANSGTYILLSNMYAAAGNWDGVARMRTIMKDTGVAKEPGCSSIEVDNKVHEFLAGDRRHPRSKDIYVMLEKMNGWLQAQGYKPQTDIVLHDIGESQKQQSLEVHSERLAIAFGLISTKPGTPIKIVKNLRVCSDCHAVTKLISKITGRRIIMREIEIDSTILKMVYVPVGIIGELHRSPNSLEVVHGLFVGIRISNAALDCFLGSQ